METTKKRKAADWAIQGQEREAKKKATSADWTEDEEEDDDDEQEVVISSARSSPLREPYLPNNSNPALAEAFKLAKSRYQKKEDGQQLARGSGFWVDWDEENKTGIVLTTAHLICSKKPHRLRGAKYATDADVTVHLRDGSSKEGRLIYHQEHYDLAFISVRVDQPVQLPSFNDGVKSGQLVFRLGRDESGNLRITHGRPRYLNPHIYERPHYMYLPDEVGDVQYDDGGLIIDLDAKVVGMVNNTRSGSFVPSSILLNCLDLWKKFGFICRPHLGLAFSVLRFLDPVRVEKILCKYKIDSGLIVEEVAEGSQAEEVGFRRGDIIECVNGERISTTIQLENMLLSLCKSAGNGVDAKVHVSVGVFHTRKHHRSTKQLTVGVSDHGEVIERGRYPVTLGGEGTNAASV